MFWSCLAIEAAEVKVVKSAGVRSAHLEVFAAEFIGTAVLVGLSLVILMFGSGSPIVRIMPSEAVGKVSGAHINPVVTLGFRLMGKMQSGLAAG